MATYGYVRVSTTRQAQEGESLDVQQRTIAGYALMKGLVLDRVFVERGVSGSVPLSQRPEGALLLNLTRTGDSIITAKLDRAFRSAMDALDVLSQLREKRVSLHMVDLGGDVATNGISKLVFTILSAVAEAERDRIRERIQDVKSDQKARGRYLGGSRPFGWDIGSDGGMIPREDEQAALRTMQSLRAQGLSLRGIAQHLASAGHQISHMTVRQALAPKP